MRFEILDVGHGFSCYLLADNGNVMLFDCGHKSSPEFLPSTVLRGIGCTGIERFFVTNYDEDHISDLPSLRQMMPVSLLHRNKSISPEQLRALKLEQGPLSHAMEHLLEMAQQYSHPASNAPHFPNVSFNTFHNSYGVDFCDTNNLSLVTFLHFRDQCALIPGDLETAGWAKLLTSQAFQAELGSVTIFIASHHGRENGYCADAFRYCRPNVIVFSDGPKRFATQEMVDAYARHARGVQFNGQTRRVLTTRNDGSVRWDV